MYYSHPCSYCGKVFYTYLDGDRYKAAEILHDRIVEHLHAYGEHDKEFDFDDGREIDMMEVYNQLTESNSPPADGYVVYEGAVLLEEYSQHEVLPTESVSNPKEAINSSASYSSSNITLSLLLMLLLLIALVVLIFLV